MKQLRYTFSSARVTYYLDSSLTQLKQLTKGQKLIVITDQHIYALHKSKLSKFDVIIIRAGEENKTQKTVDHIIQQLIEREADRKTMLVGIGGGVITDLTGYVGSIYMRGMPFAFVPTTLLSMVDASIGGKNGIDVGMYKNLVGITRQPSFILHDLSLLKTLPEALWKDGFAEIIKHASIRNLSLFKELEANSLEKYRSKKKLLSELIEQNVKLKSTVVKKDEFEKGERRTLNFGHTLGHAIENQYQLSHGQAVAIGMAYACQVSQKINGFSATDRVKRLIEQYGLPVHIEFDRQKTMDLLKLDKKRERNEMNYVLLEKIGKAVVHAIPIMQLETIVESLT